MNTNRISVSITNETITEINSKLDELKELLAPCLVMLTMEERHDLPKMSEKSLSFVSKVHDYCASNPELVPDFMDVAELNMDFKTVSGLKPILGVITQLQSNLDDTLLLAGSEAYSASLMFYGNSQLSAKHGVPNAKPIVDDLKARFPGRSKNGGPTPPQS